MCCRLAMGIGRVRSSIVDVGEANIRDLHIGIEFRAQSLYSADPAEEFITSSEDLEERAFAGSLKNVVSHVDQSADPSLLLLTVQRTISHRGQNAIDYGRPQQKHIPRRKI